LPRPVYKLKVASTTFDSGTSDEVVRIRTEVGMDVPVDVLEASLRLGGHVSKFGHGDSIVASFGYDGSPLKQVFKGRLATTETGLSVSRIVAYSSAWALVNLRLNKLYENQTAGQIVKDLCQGANVTVSKAEDGISFPSYVIDDGTNTWGHLEVLAAKCGFDVFMTKEDELVFKKFAASNGRTFEFGVDIIDASGWKRGSEYGSVHVLGESPSSTKGSDTWHWLTKNEVEGVAGSNKPLALVDPSIRDKDTAEKVAKASLDEAQREMDLILVTPGDANLQLDGTVKLKGMPDSAADGEYQVRGIEHVFSKSDGFKTTLHCRSV